MRRRKSFLGLAILALATTRTSVVQAQETRTGMEDYRPHIVGAAFGGASGGGVDTGGVAVSPRAKYQYQYRGWDIGAEFIYWAPRISAAALMADVRWYWPIGTRGEFGFSIKFGGSYEYQSRGSLRYAGPAAGVGPDVRVWVSRAIGIEFGADVIGGASQLVSSNTDVVGTAGLGAATFWVGALARF